MKVLNLTIKHKYLCAVLEGRKVQEVREVRPNNIKRYLQLDSEGYEVEDEHGNSQPVPYDAIRFRSRENADDYALVEIKESYCEMFTDDEGKLITYQHGLNSEGEPLFWAAEQVVYRLGKILDYCVTNQETSRTE